MPTFYQKLLLPLWTAVAVPLCANVGDATESPQELDPCVVTATPLRLDAAELTVASHVIGAAEWRRTDAGNLGQTLAQRPGISATGYAPGASRPMIRGLGGDRVRLLNNGVEVFDASAASPDHAAALEARTAERVEVITGPATLLYGGSAIGGVVNVIDGRLPTQLPERPVAGGVSGRYETGDAGRSGTAQVSGGQAWGEARGLAWHVDGATRRSENLQVPDAGAATGHADVVPNSAVDTQSAGAGAAWIERWGSVGAAYSGYSTVYGVPAEESVTIDLNQHRWDGDLGLRFAEGPVERLQLRGGHTDYLHRELEDGEVGTVFTNEGVDLRLEAVQRTLGAWSGALGGQTQALESAVVGDEAFLPSTDSERRAVFLLQSYRWENWRWELGARLEGTDWETRDGSGRERSETLPSASLGGVWSFAPGHNLALSLGHYERAPNAQELYADGPHVGTQAYEIGDPDLRREQAQHMELSWRRLVGPITGRITLFHTRFDGFIDEDATGEIEDELPVYRFHQHDAHFTGGEAEAVVHLHQWLDQPLDFTVGLDHVRAEAVNGEDLPRIPPLRGLLGLTWSPGRWTLGIDAELVAAQTRVAENETPTDGYVLLGLSAVRRFSIGDTTWEIFARVRNLTDAEARMHTSFLKDIVPLPGRSLGVGASLEF